MSDMDVVESVIDNMIEEYESRKNDECDALDVALIDCGIGTLKLLKSRLRIIN